MTALVDVPIDWRQRAACADNPEPFYADHRGQSCHEALAICRRCPVKAECLRHALAHNETGIWGGTTGYQRRELRRRRRAS